jgi:hypothetical protein
MICWADCGASTAPHTIAWWFCEICAYVLVFTPIDRGYCRGCIGLTHPDTHAAEDTGVVTQWKPRLDDAVSGSQLLNCPCFWCSGEQQLQHHGAMLFEPWRVCEYFETILHRIGAGGHGLAFAPMNDLHQAQPTGAPGFQSGMVAEMGDVDTRTQSYIQQVFMMTGRDSPTINNYLNYFFYIFLCHVC